MYFKSLTLALAVTTAGDTTESWTDPATLRVHGARPNAHDKSNQPYFQS